MDTNMSHGPLLHLLVCLLAPALIVQGLLCIDLLLCSDLLLCHDSKGLHTGGTASISTQPAQGTVFEIRLPPGGKRYAKYRDKEAVLSVHPRMNQETHGDEYFYGLLLQHLPWRDESQLLQPWDTAERALLEHRRLGNISTDEHFT